MAGAALVARKPEVLTHELTGWFALVTATLTLGLSKRTGPLRDLTLYGAANQTPTPRAIRVSTYDYRDGIASPGAEGGWSLCCLIADQAVREESNEVASHHLQHAGYLKEDIVGG